MSDNQAIRWGVLGTGKIAQDFVANLAKVEGAVKQSVFSRNPDNADQFARQFGFASARCSLDDFFEDPLVDLVYIATPTPLHFEHCLMAAKNGKGILCEKPFTLAWEQAQEVVAFCRSQNVFCMEAMWMRFNPVVQRCKQLIDQHAIGDIRSVNIEIGYRKDLAQLGQPEDGRGAMHVFGCYALSLASYLWGQPLSQHYEVVRTNAGVDIHCAVRLDYADHVVSIIAAIEETQSNEVSIVGTAGSIYIPSPFIDATSLRLRGDPRSVTGMALRMTDKFAPILRPFGRLRARYSNLRGSGLRGEAEEAMRCVRHGLLESPAMPQEESLGIHRLLDEIRRPVN